MTGLSVVQWATGNIGTKALREVIDHPRLDPGRAVRAPRPTRPAATRVSCAAGTRSG